MPTPEHHHKLYHRRRKYRDRIVGLPWHRRLGKRLEEFNKRFTIAALGKLLGVHPVQPPIDLASIESVLILRFDAIGDMIMTTPVWRVLKQRYPHLKIGVVCSFRNRPLIESDPDVDFVFETAGESLKEVRIAAKATAAHKWSVVLPMLYHRKTEMAIACRLLAPGAIASMVLLPNNSVKRYQHLFHIVIPTTFGPDEARMTERIKYHVEQTFGLQIPASEWSPAIHIEPTKQSRIRGAIADTLKADGTSRYIHINLEAKNSFREFGVGNTFELTKALRIRHPSLTIFWTASPVGIDNLNAYLSERPLGAVHVLPTQSVQELAAVVEDAALVISPDTSVIHLASAFEKPVLGFYYVRNEWAPWNTANIVLYPPHGSPASEIPVVDAIEAAEELLRNACVGGVS